jgi:predicted ArsR family transcriptional regulator
MKLLYNTVLALVKEHGNLWRGDDAVKQAGLSPETFRDTAERLVARGEMVRSSGDGGNGGRPRIYYSLPNNKEEKTE